MSEFTLDNLLVSSLISLLSSEERLTFTSASKAVLGSVWQEANNKEQIAMPDARIIFLSFLNEIPFVEMRGFAPREPWW